MWVLEYNIAQLWPCCIPTNVIMVIYSNGNSNKCFLYLLLIAEIISYCYSYIAHFSRGTKAVLFLLFLPSKLRMSQ